MSYLLHIDVSCQSLEVSTSRKLGKSFVEKFTATHPGVEVQYLDLATKIMPLLDAEANYALFTPEESRSEGMKKKTAFRMELINQLKGADHIVACMPMHKWNIPASFKAYIDQIIVPGVNDNYTKCLAGKKVTICMACGGSYSPGSYHPEWDFATGYLKLLFTNLGSEDVEVIRSEYCLAGLVPGMEGLVDKKAESFLEATAAAIKRAGEL